MADGTAWTVRRLRLPRRRWKSREAGEAGAYAAELPFAGIVFAALALLLLVIAVLPFAFRALELLVLAALLAYRVPLGKPWTVEARSDAGERRRRHVRGRRRPGAAAERIVQAPGRGEKPAVA